MLFVDTAEPGLIEDAAKIPGVRGVTTNPTLMAGAAGVEFLLTSDYIARARHLCLLAKRLNLPHLMIQGIGSPEQILQQAEIYRKDLASGPTQVWIKLTPLAENLAAIPALAALGCKTLVTAVFNAPQAYMAMEAGADGIAVYLGRLMRLEKQWEEPLARMRDVVSGVGKMLLMASFPDVQVVENALRFSTDLTVPPAILQEMLQSPHTEAAIKAFDSKISPSLDSAA